MARTPSTEDVYVGDGTTAVFQFHFPFLRDTDVFVSVDDVNVSFTILPGSTAQVQLTVPPAVGSIVKVYRSTLAYVPEHLFASGVPFLPRYVDENNRQLLYASQEAINDTAVTAAEALVVAEEAKQIAQEAEDKIDGAIIDSSYQLRLDLAEADGAALIGQTNVRYGGNLFNYLDRLPYYLSAAGLPTGGDDTVAFQTLLDSIPIGGTLILDNNTDILVSDSILARRNHMTVWRTGGGFIKLTGSTSQGHVFAVFDGSTSGAIIEGVKLINLGIDGGSFGYPTGADGGENGIAGTRCKNVTVLGGHVKNCREGALRSYGTGGKGCQFEFGVANILVQGVLIEDCSIAMETGGLQNDVAPNDFRTSVGVMYTNMTVHRCERVISMNQPFSPPNVSVTVNSAVFDGIQAFDCGRGEQSGQELYFGCIILDRYANATVRNVTIKNQASYGSISAVVRFIRGEGNRFENIVFEGVTEALVSHVKPVATAGYTAAGLLRRNTFDVSCPVGTVTTLLKAASADVTGTLTNSDYKLAALSPTSLVTLDSGELATTVRGDFTDLATGKRVQGPVANIRTTNAFPTQLTSFVGAIKLNTLVYSFGTGSDSMIADGTLNIYTGGSVDTPRMTLTATNTLLTAGDYANDAAAQAAGVPVGYLYYNSTTGALTKRKV